MKQRKRDMGRALAVRAAFRQLYTLEYCLPAALLLALLCLSVAALGQENLLAPQAVVPPPAGRGSGSTVPGSKMGSITGTGVIRPPTDVDPGIKARPPVPTTELPTPVIPPPGTSGGNQTVQPK